MFVDGKEGLLRKDQHPFGTTNIGSKWCYLEEYDDDYLFGEVPGSAREGLHWLAEQLGELDPELLMNVSFEDEMPNFVGWSVFDGADLWDEGMEDDDAISDIVSKYSRTPTLMTRIYHEAL